MANGFAPYVLRTINALAGNDNPEYKISPFGFVRMLMAANAVRGARVLELSTPQGQKRTTYVKYAPRTSENYVQEEDNCEVDFTPSYMESELTAPRVAKIGIYISFEDLRKYMEDAITPATIGTSTVSNELYQTIVRSANAIVGKIDARLLGDVTWGVNQVSGNNSVVTVNFAQDQTVNNLTTGFTKILADAMANEMWGGLEIVGSGLFNNYQLQKMVAGAASNGLDVSKFTGYNWYFDVKAAAASTFGSNNIGVFSKGSIGFVDLNKYIGAFAGELGTSTLFQMTLPVATTQNDGSVQMMTFDAQLKPIECPTTLVNGYTDQTATYDKGYQLILTKNYGLWQVPAGAYDGADRLHGNNGSLRYAITNS